MKGATWLLLALCCALYGYGRDRFFYRLLPLFGALFLLQGQFLPEKGHLVLIVLFLFYGLLLFHWIFRERNEEKRRYRQERRAARNISYSIEKFRSRRPLKAETSEELGEETRSETSEEQTERVPGEGQTQIEERDSSAHRLEEESQDSALFREENQAVSTSQEFLGDDVSSSAKTFGRASQTIDEVGQSSVDATSSQEERALMDRETQISQVVDLEDENHNAFEEQILDATEMLQGRQVILETEEPKE